MFKNLKRKIDITIEEVVYAVKDFTTAARELKCLSLPRKLDEISSRVKKVDDGIEAIYRLFKRYIESKEISEINKLRTENETLRDCITEMEKRPTRKKIKKQERSFAAKMI